MSFNLNDLLALLAGSNPQAGLIGAGVYFLIQLFIGHKLPNLSGWLKTLIGVKPAAVSPAPAPADPVIDHPAVNGPLDFLFTRIRARLKDRVTGANADPMDELAKLNEAFKNFK